MSLFPTSTCSAEDVDARGVDLMIRGWRDHALELHELVLVRHGKLLTTATWAPWRADVPKLVHSVSKTLVGMAVGLCVGDGLLTVDDAASSFFPEIAELAPGTEQITVHHLLSMTTGHTTDTLGGMWTRPPEDWWEGFFAQAPQQAVGSLHIYHNGASTVLAEIVRRASGRRLVDLLDERLVQPMGMPPLVWKCDGAGREIGFSGAFLLTEQIAAFAELLRCDGVWQGTRLLPEGWAGLQTSMHTPTGASVNPHALQGYGYQLWGDLDGFRLDGAAGQYGLVLPDRELVVGIAAGESPTQPILDTLYAQLLPALDVASVAAPLLVDDLQIPVAQGEPVGHAVVTRGAPSVVDKAATGTSWYYPSISDVALSKDLVVSFTCEGEDLSLPCGNTTWLESQLTWADGRHVLASARAVAVGDDVVVDVAFLESPYRLTFTLLPDGTATMRFNAAVVHPDGLAGLGAAQGTVTATR